MVNLRLEPQPFYLLSFLNAGAGHHAGSYSENLPFYKGTIEGLPAGTPPLMLTADLQGRTDYGDSEETLLGVAIPNELFEIGADFDLPAPDASLALLAGDFYTYPNASKRGGTGHVDAVWEQMEAAFAETFGVAGNHDLFKNKPRNLLEGQCRHYGKLRIAGVSGIIGNPAKPNRLDAREFAARLDNVLSEAPHILLLHAAPDLGDDAPGSVELTQMLIESNFSGLIVCGHVHWEQRVQRLGRATVLNVHEAVVLLDPQGGE